MSAFRCFGLLIALLTSGCSSDEEATTGTTRVEYVVRDGLPTNSVLSAVVIDGSGIVVAAIDKDTYHYDFDAKAYVAEFSSMSQQPVYAPDGHVFLVGYINRGTWTLSRQL